jgi:hypothetical protein
LGNSAAGGGNDIGHELNVQGLYNSSNFWHTCSSSEGDKIAFANGTNLNHLLLSMSAMILFVSYVLIRCSFQHV